MHERELNVGKKQLLAKNIDRSVDEVLRIVGKNPDNFADIPSRFFSKIISRSGNLHNNIFFIVAISNFAQHVSLNFEY